MQASNPNNLNSHFIFIGP